MSPFVKGALGFLGCAGICTVAYQIGKYVGREETLKDVEREEKVLAAEQKVAESIVEQKEEPVEKVDILPNGAAEVTTVSPEEQPIQQTAVERVRKKHGIKNKIFSGTSVIKDLLGSPDNKQITVTFEEGDVVARISQKQGG